MRKNFALKTLLVIFFLSKNLGFSQQIKIKTENIPIFKLDFVSEHYLNENYEYEQKTYYDSIPKLSTILKIKKRKVLVAFFTDLEDFTGETVLATYYNFANTWQKLHQLNFTGRKIIGDLDFYSNKETGTEYVYYQYFTAGGSAGNADFTFALYNVMENKSYELSYSGSINGKVDYLQIWDGKFNFEKLLDNPEILKILEYKASKSKHIYRP